MKRILAMACAAALLCSCKSMEQSLHAKSLDNAMRDYDMKMRWREMFMACSDHVDAPLLEECTRRAEAAREVRIADYRQRSVEYDPEHGTARAIVEFDYYLPPTYTLKTAVDRQEWALVGKDDEAKQWRLKSLPPEFK